MTSLPIQGMPLHTRALSVVISRAAPDRWLARGDVIDLRKHGFVPATYDLQPSGVIHSMNIELEFDPESLILDEIRVEQPFVAIESSPETGGECCRDPAPRLLALRGEKLDVGFTRRLSAVFGGRLGCSHLLTLFQLMASTIPRAAVLEHAREQSEGTEQRIGERLFRRSLYLDGHDRSDQLIDLAVQLADTHSRPIGAHDPVLERLALSHEVKLHAAIERKRFRVQSLNASERSRSHDAFGGAQWMDHDERLSTLVGVPLIPGLAGRIFGLLGGDETAAPLRDALLQMAPGFIQVMAAVMDSYYEERSRKAPGEPSEAPAVANIGGNHDSCYMWRSDGYVLKSWAAREHDRHT